MHDKPIGASLYVPATHRHLLDIAKEDKGIKLDTELTADDLKAVGPMMLLLNEALLPNLVQTTEGAPAIVHCGPFANIAHGTSSVLAQRIGLHAEDATPGSDHLRDVSDCRHA